MIIQGNIKALDGTPYNGSLKVNDIDGNPVAFRVDGEGQEMSTEPCTITDGKVELYVVGNPQALIVIAIDAPTIALVVDGVWMPSGILNTYSGTVTNAALMVGPLQITNLNGCFTLSGRVVAGGAATVICTIPPEICPANGAVTLCTVNGTLTVVTISAAGSVELPGATVLNDVVVMVGTTWTINT